MRKDRDVAQRAEIQHGVVHREQALAAGLTPAGVHRRKSAGLLVPCQPGVVRVAGAPATWHGEVLAAVLSAGGDAVASHRSAGLLWQIDGIQPGTVELTVPLGYPPPRRRAIVHRAVTIDPRDRTVIDAIPVTRIDATLIALAAVLRPDSIADVVDSALVQGLTRADKVLVTLDRLGRRGRRNAGVLAGVLEQRLGRARSHVSFERRLSDVLVRSGATKPVPQFEVRVAGRVIARPDLAYPDLRIAIEADSYRWHGGLSRMERDLARRTELAAAGWLVLHFSWRALVERPCWVVEKVKEAVDTRRL